MRNIYYLRSFFGSTGGGLRANQIVSIYDPVVVDYRVKSLKWFLLNIINFRTLRLAITLRSFKEVKYTLQTLFRNYSYIVKPSVIIFDVHRGSSMMLPLVLSLKFPNARLLYIAHNAEYLNTYDETLADIERRNSSLCKMITISKVDTEYFSAFGGSCEMVPFEYTFPLKKKENRFLFVNISLKNHNQSEIEGVITRLQKIEFVVCCGDGTENLSFVNGVGLGRVDSWLIEHLLTAATIVVALYPRMGGFPTKIVEYEMRKIYYTYIGYPRVIEGYDLKYCLHMLDPYNLSDELIHSVFSKQE